MNTVRGSPGTVPMPPRLAVNVRIRGRGETTIETKFDDLESVRAFKARVFGPELRDGRQCRLIARGRELRDSSSMGSYNIGEGSYLHVMIGKEGSAARAARNMNTSSADQRGDPTSGLGLTVLFILMLIMFASAWLALFTRPELFNSGSTSMLIFLTSAVGFLSMPLLKSFYSACWQAVPARANARRRQ